MTSHAIAMRAIRAWAKLGARFKAALDDPQGPRGELVASFVAGVVQQDLEKAEAVLVSALEIVRRTRRAEPRPEP